MAYDYNYKVDADHVNPNYVPGWKTTRDADARALLFGPQALYNQLGDIANNGIFGQKGIEDISRAGRASAMFDVNQAMRYGAPGFSGRVGGADSGAYRASMINRAFVPYLGENARMKTGLMEKNIMSKGVGIEGLMQLIQFLQARKEKGKKGYQGEGSGTFDKILGSLGIAAQLASIPLSGGATAPFVAANGVMSATNPNGIPQ